ncbi:MAG: beta-carotene ketolase [Myxococcaceae bacterium]|nr:beta-carotene ketolase [Myxococcaceae bacterium]
MTPPVAPPTRRALPGVALAAAIVLAWSASLVAALALPPQVIPWALWLPIVALRTWLHTGLFIVAHDAMHGTVAPGRPRLNAAIGTVAVGLYALFPYATLAREHRGHHANPASSEDPDFHDGAHPGFGRWYLRFIGHYLRWPQVVGHAVIFNVLQHVVHVSQLSLLAFWVLPALASTAQLFYFGTFRPHRAPPGGYADAHRATSNDYGPALSLLTCFHFGYHWEHHAWPSLPWWALPSARRTPAPRPR